MTDELINKIEPYANVIVRLLKGAVYDNDKEWEDLILYLLPITEYLGRIGLEVVLDKREGYAFIKQIDLDDSGKTIGLIKRQPLSYEVSLILILLREWLDEFDINDTTSRELFVTRKDLRERTELFFKEKSNQVKLTEKIDNYISTIRDLGFLRQIKSNEKDNERFMVMRIIKGKITNDLLEDFRKSLIRDVESI